MWIFVSSCVYAPMRYPGCSTYWYLLVYFLRMKGIFLASLGFPLQLCCIKCSPTLTGMFVVLLNVDDLHFLGVLVFGCVARCNG